MNDSSGSDQAWCEQLAQEYRVPVSSVEHVLAGLKGSREGALILLEACAECALDPVATLDQARNASGPFRISRPEAVNAGPTRAELPVPPPKARTAIPRRRKEPDSGIFAARPTKASGMAAEIYLAMFQQAARS